jgi:hypothetical protein
MVRDSAVATVGRLRAELRRFAIGKYYFFLHSVRTRSGAHQPSYPMGTEGSILGKSGRVMKLYKRVELHQNSPYAFIINNRELTV